MRCFAFTEDRLFLVERDGRFRIPTRLELEGSLDPEELARALVPGPLRGDPDAFVVALGPDRPAPPGFVEMTLREAYHVLDPADFRLAGTARQRAEWSLTHRFCSRCGSAGHHEVRHDAMRCPECGQLHFPRIAPAVIVLIQREKEALLARSPRFPPGLYSTLAGFVEPGETVEECAHREIDEEVGVRVRDLRYFGSQPHPFPHSLMLGFIAEWSSGEIRLEDDEIEDARWFHRDALPKLPHPMSIARALIEDFVERTA